MRIAVIIGDVVRSSGIRNRSAFQQRFRRSLADLHGRPGLLAPYTITAGDEFEAVYSDPTRIFHDVWALVATNHPHSIRFSIALGSLTTAVDPTNPLVMDGPAFHGARAGIQALKKDRETL